MFRQAGDGLLEFSASIRAIPRELRKQTLLLHQVRQAF